MEFDKDAAIVLLKEIKQKLISMRDHKTAFQQLISDATKLDLQEVLYLDRSCNVGLLITDWDDESYVDDAIAELEDYEPKNEEDDEEEMDEDDEDGDEAE